MEGLRNESKQAMLGGGWLCTRGLADKELDIVVVWCEPLRTRRRDICVAPDQAAELRFESRAEHPSGIVEPLRLVHLHTHARFARNRPAALLVRVLNPWGAPGTLCRQKRGVQRVRARSRPHPDSLGAHCRCTA